MSSIVGSWQDRLQRELDEALREVDCQRARLHLLLHGAEDELQEALGSLSPHSPEELDSEEEAEAELVALHDREEERPLPSRVQVGPLPLIFKKIRFSLLLISFL